MNSDLRPGLKGIDWPVETRRGLRRGTLRRGKPRLYNKRK